VEVNTDRLQRALLTPELQKELARDFRSKPNQPTSPKGLPTEQKAAPSFEERWRTFRSQATDAPCGIYDVEERFRRWMYLPDAGILHVTLGTIAANLLPESSPTWLMIVGPPGGGKTEFTKPCSRLPGIHYAATLTEAALLSGSAKRDRTADASGGLLREIGEFGFLICKDFTSILSMNRDARASTLAALREVYDGEWTRCVGTDGGRSLRWKGKVGFIGCVTPILDQHHTVLSAMGERFIYYRLPPGDPERQASRAIENGGCGTQKALDLAEAVADLFRSAKIERAENSAISDTKKFAALASLVASARSAVERDGRSREVELVPEAEMPARLALALISLDAGMKSIGTKQTERWRLICKVAFDSLPALRRRVLLAAIEHRAPLGTADFARITGHPTGTVRRALEDLEAHCLLGRLKPGVGHADNWVVTRKTLERWNAAEVTFPETSVITDGTTFSEMSGEA
jgi:hypothetical protein